MHNDRYLDEVKFATYMPQDAYDRVFFRGFADSMDERLHSTSFFLDFLKKQELENLNMVAGNDSADLFPPIMEDVTKTYLKRMNNLLKKDDYQDND